MFIPQVLLASTLRAALQLPYNPASATGTLPARFWFYAAAAVLYGVAETLCGNWSTLYLTAERGVPAGRAALALTAFWVMVTLGRLFVAALERVIAARWIYLALPVLLAVVFQVVAHADSAVVGIVAFAAAGLACSALLPFSISFAGKEFPNMAAMMSGGLIAFYQIGYGLAAFGVGSLHQIADWRFSSVFCRRQYRCVGVRAGSNTASAPVRRSPPSAAESGSRPSPAITSWASLSARPSFPAAGSPSSTTAWASASFRGSRCSNSISAATSPVSPYPTAEWIGHSAGSLVWACKA